MISSRLPPFATGIQLSLQELLYYKSHTIHWQAPKKSLWSQLNGNHQSRYKGRGMDFAEVRQYQPGDDIRSIDWRVTARTGKVHTKLFTEEKEQPVILYIDFTPNMRFGSQLLFKSVQAAHLASLISWWVIEQKNRIGAVIDMGDKLIELKPTARHQGALQLLHHMLTYNNQAMQTLQAQQTNDVAGSDSCAQALETLSRLSPKGSHIIFISDFQRLTPDCMPRLNRLCQHNQIQFTAIFDPLEMGNTQFEGTEYVTNGRITQWINFGSKTTRQELKDHYLHHQAHIEKVCLDLAIPLRLLSAAHPLLSQLNIETSHSRQTLSQGEV